jgi:hypothetical protein
MGAQKEDKVFINRKLVKYFDIEIKLRKQEKATWSILIR